MRIRPFEFHKIAHKGDELIVDEWISIAIATWQSHVHVHVPAQFSLPRRNLDRQLKRSRRTFRILHNINTFIETKRIDLVVS